MPNAALAFSLGRSILTSSISKEIQFLGLNFLSALPGLMVGLSIFSGLLIVLGLTINALAEGPRGTLSPLDWADKVATPSKEVVAIKKNVYADFIIK